MLGYLSLDIICSLKLTVFLELRSRKTVCRLSADKYPSIFLRQMETIVYISTIYFLYFSNKQKKEINSMVQFIMPKFGKSTKSDKNPSQFHKKTFAGADQPRTQGISGTRLGADIGRACRGAPTPPTSDDMQLSTITGIQ